MIRTTIVLGFLALWGGPALPADDSLQAFAQLPLLERPQISPDGTRYACLLSSQGRQMLAVVSTTGARPVTVAVADSDQLTRWQWVNDEWLIITLRSTHMMMGERWTVGRVYGVRASDAQVVPLGRDTDAQFASDVLWIAQDGSPRVLLAVQQSIYSSEEKFYPEVFEVDVSTGKRVSRVRPRMGIMNWYADSDGVVRMGIGYRDLSRSSTVLYRENAAESLRTLDTASARKAESLKPLPALFLAHRGKGLAFSDHSGFAALYELDLETQTLGKEVFSVPGYDIDELVMDPTGKELLGVRYTDTQPRTQWLEPIMSKAQRDLDRAFGPARSAQIISMSRNQRRLMVLASSASDPGSYYLMDLDSRTVNEISRVLPALATEPLGTVRSLRYKARDGLEIEAVLTVPAQAEPKRLPLIVMPHGGPSARDQETFDWWAQYLARLGYAVIQPNYRGSSGYGSQFAARGEGQWGLAMQDDLLDSIDHLVALGVADPEKVCIIGGSYGGYAALRAAQRDSARFRCAASFAGVSDLAGMVKFDDRYLSGFRRDELEAQAPDMKAVSPINYPEQFGTPVLLVHGKRDLVVPFTQSSSLAGKLSKAGKPVRYVELPLGDHYLSRAEDRLVYLREITAFLQEYNPARAATALD